MENIVNRLESLLLPGEKKKDFAARIGIEPNTLSGYLARGRLPSFEVLHKISQATGVSIEWLKTGEGQKYPAIGNATPVPLGHGRRIPVVGLVHAGELVEANDSEYPPGIAARYVTTDRPGKNLFAVEIEGDSMEPDFRPGDIIIVNPNLDPTIGDYVIVKKQDSGEVLFKKLVRRDPSLVQLKALNPDYPDVILVNVQEYHFIGKVVERKTIF